MRFLGKTSVTSIWEEGIRNYRKENEEREEFGRPSPVFPATVAQN